MSKPNPGKVALAIIGGAAGASAVTGGVLSAMLIAAHAPMWTPWAALYIFAITLMFSATIGLVWHVLASNRRWTSVHAYLLPGLVVGVFAVAVVLLTPNAPHEGPPSEAWGLRFAAFLIPIGGLTGAMTGAFAWLIRRPDRDANLAKPAP